MQCHVDGAQRAWATCDNDPLAESDQEIGIGLTRFQIRRIVQITETSPIKKTKTMFAKQTSSPLCSQTNLSLVALVSSSSPKPN